MAERDKATPRITVEVTHAQYEILKQHLPRGFQKRVFGIIVEDVCALLEQYGQHFVAAMLRKQALEAEGRQRFER